MANARQKSVSESSRWNFIGYGAEAVIRLSSQLILVRLVAPEAFGLMAIVSVIIVGVTLFSDLGFQPSVVRSERGDDKVFLSTVWTIQVARGFFLFVVLWAIAGLAAGFYEQPELKNLILLVALTAILDGFTSIGVHVATRHLDLKPVVILEVLTLAVSFAAVIVLASILKNVWALAIGTVIARAARALLSHLLFRQDHVGFGWDQAAFNELFGFGKWILLATALTFMAYQVDRLMLGKYVTLEELGIYAILIAWSEIPRVAMMKWASQVFYPQISKWHIDQDNFRANTQHLRGVILSIASMPMGLAIGLAAPWIALLLTQPYSDWGHLLAIMFVGIWIESIDILYHQGFLTINRPQIRSVGMTASVVLFVLLMVPAYNFMGLVGVAWLTVFCRFSRLMIQWYYAHRHGLLFALQDLAHSVVVAVIAVSMLLLTYLTSKVTTELVSLLTLSALSAVCAGLWVRWYWPQLMQTKSSSVGVNA